MRVAFVAVVMIVSDLAAVRFAVDLQNERSFDLLFVEMFQQVLVG